MGGHYPSYSINSSGCIRDFNLIEWNSGGIEIPDSPPDVYVG
jgi:hypothetical protein